MIDNQEPTSWVLPDATSHVLGQAPVVVTTASPDNANQFALDFAQAFLHSNSPLSHDEMIKWVTKAAALIEEQARLKQELYEWKEQIGQDIQGVIRILDKTGDEIMNLLGSPASVDAPFDYVCIPVDKPKKIYDGVHEARNTLQVIIYSKD